MGLTLLPNFLSGNCLKKRATGHIEYDFGEESYMSSTELANISAKPKTPKSPKKSSSKRKCDYTPQKGERKKIQSKPRSSPLKCSNPRRKLIK